MRKPSLLFSLPLGTRRLPVHYFLSEQKKCIFRLCNVVRVKKQGATGHSGETLHATPGEDSEEERQGGTPQAEEELSPGDHAEALDTGGAALRAYRIKWCSRGGHTACLGWSNTPFEPGWRPERLHRPPTSPSPPPPLPRSAPLYTADVLRMSCRDILPTRAGLG